jgi:cobyrinic acid a,c-diamide synthase
VIAAPHGRSGKTVISVGLCAALASKGRIVQPFKKGPDYIDPSWLSAAAGRSCQNLDLFMMSSDAIVESFQRAAGDAEVAIIEGAMGLYDGCDLAGSGSTAQLARLLRAPVILVVDATRMTRSAAALVAGYQRFEEDVNIAGVLFNRVGTARHENMLRQAIEKYCGLPVVGCIPKSEDLSIPNRHLGLVPQGESENAIANLDSVGRIIATYVDLDMVESIANSAPVLPDMTHGLPDRVAPVARLGVIKDRVFTFYYPENLEQIRASGIELVFIDSLQDSRLPDVDGLYIGGGFPEVFAAELQANESLRRDIARAVDEGLPVYAECGGLMYLCRSLIWGDQRWEMVGALPCDVEVAVRPQGHGYVAAEVVGNNPFFPVGTQLKGHEFHHSRLLGAESLQSAYLLSRGAGIGDKRDGIVYKGVLASYTHLLGMKGWTQGFLARAAGQRLEQGVCVHPNAQVLAPRLGD